MSSKHINLFSNLLDDLFSSKKSIFANRYSNMYILNKFKPFIYLQIFFQDHIHECNRDIILKDYSLFIMNQDKTIITYLNNASQLTCVNTNNLYTGIYTINIYHEPSQRYTYLFSFLVISNIESLIKMAVCNNFKILINLNGSNGTDKSNITCNLEIYPSVNKIQYYKFNKHKWYSINNSTNANDICIYSINKSTNFHTYFRLIFSNLSNNQFNNQIHAVSYDKYKLVLIGNKSIKRLISSDSIYYLSLKTLSEGEYIICLFNKTNKQSKIIGTIFIFSNYYISSSYKCPKRQKYSK
jgi:hypothetical protein